ncbi:unnamed protein product [Durusdinium trenchii]|uniref:Activator of Hsp90 ATPase AHSA1-like N-terminal domain-containing protein n=1 Tax=Durusdinium trenchii TaxID=1381693 RepID=A0ABP0LBD7_9DINO
MAWDEKNRDEWAKRYLETTFKETVIPLEGTEGAKMSFFRVEPRGDCALAVKKGQPQPIFELKIDLDWKVEQPIENGKSMLEAKGQIQVTDFSSEDSSEPQMKLICDNQLPPDSHGQAQWCSEIAWQDGGCAHSGGGFCHRAEEADVTDVEQSLHRAACSCTRSCA